MMKIKLNVAFFVIMLFALNLALIAQDHGKIYEGPDDPAGDIEAEREGYMTGNRILLYFQNTTELAKWTPTYRGSQWSRWPNTYDGVRMLDGIALLIGAKVYIKNDSIPVTDFEAIANGQYDDVLYYLQTSYREEMDRNPTGTVEWGLYPVYGYFNELSEYPAMSNHKESWPPAGWPSTGRSLKWPGEWNGRFGRGVIYADLETYFVANDAQDLEYLGPDDRVKYYPRRKYDAQGNIIQDIRIGDIRPEVSIQKGEPWGGLGIRVEQRGFQWNNPQARDAIFWEYNIANISEYTLPEVAFGYWVDNGIGGESDDELGYFDTKIDMAYSWDKDGKGEAGKPTGTMGFAYLESPGIPYDGKDNDEDGLVDERRDNPTAGEFVGPYDGIDNLENFLDFYNLKEEDLRPHWSSDEDQDWEDGNDLNGDGVYQANEYAGDDVGLDGVGPQELNYTGPDEGECNHMPDYKQGVGCEPNYNATDVSESDMVGLTSFYMFPVPQHNPPYTRWFRNDQSMWELIGQDSLVEYLGNISNLIETFASGPFPLYQGREERISMSELHSFDALEGLNSDEHSAPALYEVKRIVQVIYEKDYRFAQPPKMPTLTATPLDGKVILTWDNVADTKTRDPFLGNVNDFEGYKLFRATDKKMSDAQVITDGFGNPIYLKPIFQCDLKDGIQGFADYGAINGIQYNLGYDTGIVHHFVDENVQNGRTYYYAIVAYDYGAPHIGPGIAPSENNIVIELDEAEEIRRLEDGSLAIGPNVAVVTPRQDAAGYVPPSIDQQDDQQTLGTGNIEPEILARNSLKIDHTYKVKFQIDTLLDVPYYDFAIRYTTNGLRIYDVTDGNKLVYEETPENYAYSNLIYRDTLDYWTLKTGKTISTDIFDGLRLNITQEVELAEYDARKSGWLKGDAPLIINPASGDNLVMPWDYEIVFTANDSAYVGRVNSQHIRDEQNVRINRTRLLFHQNFNFYVLNKSFMDSAGNYLKMDLVVEDRNYNRQFDIEDRILVGDLNTRGYWAATAFSFEFATSDSADLPQADDVYRVYHKRPFWISDSVTFTVKPEGALNETVLKSTMDDIKVVPNPYIATNAMEPAVANPFLNQRRRLMFTHIPAQCTIKIFTVSGVLVDQIDVQNEPSNGIVHWDLKTREGLDVAAGMYIYHVKSLKTGDEKIGKFAIIK
ncbi:fibronectin type III domain-containing protein [Calditrichota bacterium LG25]